MKFLVSADPVLNRIRKFIKYNRKKLIISGAVLVPALILFFHFSTFCAMYEAPLALANWMVKFICTTGNYESVSGYMNEATTYLQSETFNRMTGVTQVIQTTALTICMMLWIPTLITAYINQQAYAEVVVKKIMVLAISCALICNSTTICLAITGVGSDLAAKIGGESGSGIDLDQVTGMMKQMCEDRYNMTYEEHLAAENETDESTELDDDASYDTKVVAGLFDGIPKWWWEHVGRGFSALGIAIVYIACLLIPLIASVVSRVIIVIACYSRGVEIAVLTILSPIPFAILTNDPFGSGVGVRFMKNLGALALQGAVMMVVCIVCSALIIKNMQSAVANFGDLSHVGEIIEGFLNCAAVSVCEAFLLIKSLSISQKILGLQ